MYTTAGRSRCQDLSLEDDGTSREGLVMTCLPRRRRVAGQGTCEEFGEEALEPPPTIRRELGPDRGQWVRWRNRGRGGTQLDSLLDMSCLRDPEGFCRSTRLTPRGRLPRS